MKWANKNKIIFIFTMFFLKIQQNTCRYHYQNLDDMNYSSWDIEQNILKLVTLGHFLLFYPPKKPKIKIWKNEENCWRYHHFTHVYQESQHMMYNSWDTEWDRHSSLSFWAIFCPFTNPLMILKIKILKKTKCLEILSFYTYKCTIHEDHMIPEI